MDGITTYELDEIFGTEPQNFTPRKMPDEIFALEKRAPDFFKNFFERLELGLDKSDGVADASWDTPISVTSALDKRASLPATGSMAKRLGITRTKLEIINGETWAHAFNAAGDLVDARVIETE